MATYKLSTEQKETICREYRAGMSTIALAKQYERSHQALNEMLRRHGVRLRTHSEAVPRIFKYSCDHSFFDVIDSEPKAYWLGFMAADGYVHTKRRALVLGLHTRDGDHVERFREVLQSNHALLHIPSQPSTRLAIVSTQLTAGLISHGVTQAKSLTLEWPTHLGEFTRHYLRGYFDGDGHVKIIRTRYPETPNIRIGFAGNHQFLTDCRAFLMATLGFNEVKLQPGPNGARHFYLEYGGGRQIVTLYRLLYARATIWLPRKREKLDPWV